MAEVKSMFREVLPKQGQLSVEDVTTMVLCKPKLLPLKSLTLEKLEKMQQAAQDTVRQQEMAEKATAERSGKGCTYIVSCSSFCGRLESRSQSF